MDLAKRIDEHDRQFARHEKMMERIDKRLDKTTKLVQDGMKLVIAERKQQKEINAAFQYKLNAVINTLDRLAANQKRTDAKLDRFIDVLRRGNRNGHSS